MSDISVLDTQLPSYPSIVPPGIRSIEIVHHRGPDPGQPGPNVQGVSVWNHPHLADPLCVRIIQPVQPAIILVAADLLFISWNPET